MAADGTMQQEELQLTATVLQIPWAQPFDVWAAVRRARSSVRGQDGEATAARTAATRAVEACLGGLRVRDVTALPKPALVTGAGFSSPAQWADTEFQHRWQQLRAGLLRPAGKSPEGGHGQRRRRVAAVAGERLAADSKRDAELAYLARFEQHGPTVPFGGRRAGDGVEPAHAVVLAVPRFAARHAADHTRDDRHRVVLGPELVAGTAEPDKRDVLALLRGAYPCLPADAEAMGGVPGPRPLHDGPGGAARCPARATARLQRAQLEGGLQRSGRRQVQLGARRCSPRPRRR